MQRYALDFLMAQGSISESDCLKVLAEQVPRQQEMLFLARDDDASEAQDGREENVFTQMTAPSRRLGCYRKSLPSQQPKENEESR
jgi:hypothetical protein